jgi:LmeA-like phospholipid-binding
MVLGNPDLGENALSKVAEIGIASQLDEVDNIDVDIRTNPGKLVQGKLDSVSISGQGLVMKQDLRVETLEVSIDEVAINPLSAVFGNIELTHPTDAEAQIVLTEADINRAFNSDFIQDKFRDLKMEVEGRPVIVDVQQATIHLPGDNKFVINADFLLKEQGEVKKLSATAVPHIQEDGYMISLEILSTEGQGLPKEAVVAIFDQLAALLDLRNFNIPGMSLQFHQLEAQKGRLVIHANTHIEQLPSG